jgi:hypothetical protein
MGNNPGLSDLVPGPENPLLISSEPFVIVFHVKTTDTSSHFASSAKCEDDVYITSQARSVKMLHEDISLLDFY